MVLGVATTTKTTRSSDSNQIPESARHKRSHDSSLCRAWWPNYNEHHGTFPFGGPKDWRHLDTLSELRKPERKTDEVITVPPKNLCLVKLNLSN